MTDAERKKKERKTKRESGLIRMERWVKREWTLEIDRTIEEIKTKEKIK
jgi:hypothetical protein